MVQKVVEDWQKVGGTYQIITNLKVSFLEGVHTYQSQDPINSLTQNPPANL
jgi:hypothetical protein